MKASYDLGNGLQAIGKFEWQTSTVLGEINDGHRDAYVGLKGGFGELQVGSIKSAYKYTGGVAYDAFVTTNLEARRYGAMSTGTFGQNGFLERSIGYVGNFGGVGVWLTYSPDEVNGSSASDGDYTAALKFSPSKAWEVFVSAAHDDETGTATAPVGSYDAMKLGGKFSTGAHTFLAQYETLTGENADPYNGDDLDGDVWFLGYQLGMGANTFVAQYGQGSVDFSTTSQDDDYYALGVIHKLTKQARVWAGYGSMTVDNAVGVSGNDGDRDAISVGMRVDF